MQIILFTFILFTTGFNTPAPTWSTAEIAKANTAKDVKYFTEEEKKTIMLVNLARLDGTKYLQTYFQEYNSTAYNQMTKAKSKYMRSLKKDMDKVKNLPMLLPDEGLARSSKYHAKDSGKNGIVGHTSSNGTTFSKRVPKYVKGWNNIAENCSYGHEGAADIVGQLLLDEGVASLGHRKSILNGELEYIGVSIQTHTKYRFNCVMDFCAKFDN